MGLEPYFSTKEEEMIMTKSRWMTMGTILKMNAINFPDKLGWQDKSKGFTFKQWNDRACRLADGLTRLELTIKTAWPSWPSIVGNGWIFMPVQPKEARSSSP